MPKIDTYSPGKIVIEGKAYNNDVKVFPDKVVPNWWREQGHSLSVKDVQDVLNYKPELVVIGQGYDCNMAVPEQTRKRFTAQGTDILVKPTAEAVNSFNDYLAKGKKVVGLFHLTC